MTQEEDPEKSNGLFQLAERRRTFLKASLAGALGVSSLPLLSSEVAWSTGTSTLYEEDFEDIPLGGAPSDWTVDSAYPSFETYRVEEGGAAGSQHAFRLKTDPYSVNYLDDGGENWASVVFTPRVDAPVSEVEWYWKKPHKYDPENYDALRAFGPGLNFRNENGKTFVGMQLGRRDGYLSGEEYPLGLAVSDGDDRVLIHDVYEADKFSKFVVKPDFEAETFGLLVDGTSLGTFKFARSASELSRLRFHVGGWGVSGNSEVDEFRVSGTPKVEGPVAKFEFKPKEPVVGDLITFDASDSEGSIVAYQWDFDDDGEFDKTGETVQHQFTAPGDQTVTLQVTDDDGETATASLSFNTELRGRTQKRNLAGRIDTISLTPLNDQQRAEETLTDLSNAVKKGTLDFQTAEDTITRMRAGERVTQTVLESIGPKTVIDGTVLKDGEVEEKSLGVVYGLTRDLARPVIETALTIYVGVKGYQAETTSGLLGQTGQWLIQEANKLITENIFTILDWFFGTFKEGSTKAKKSIKMEGDSIVAQLIESGDAGTKLAQQLVSTAVDTILDGIAAVLRTFFEQGITIEPPVIPYSDLSIETSLDHLHSRLNLEEAKSGLSGSTEAAQTASQKKIDRIENRSAQIDQEIDKAEKIGEDTNLINAVGDLYEGGNLIDLFEVFIGIVNTLVGSLMDALTSGKGLVGLIQLEIQHSLALYLIVEGRETL